MPHKLFTVLLLLIGLCPFDATAQQEEYIVISVNGLKLRKTPSQSGLVLAVAPLGARVTVLSEPEKEWEGWSDHNTNRYLGRSKIDTIGLAMEVEENDDNGRKKKIKVPHIGFWWRVRYEGRVGYMFSGFLLPPGWRGEEYEISSSFRLRTPGLYANPVSEPGWLWYGLFAAEKGFSLRPVEVRYLAIDYRLMSADLRKQAGFIEELTTDRIAVIQTIPEEPLMLIGTRDSLKENLYLKGEVVHYIREYQYVTDYLMLNPPKQPEDIDICSKADLKYKTVPDTGTQWYFSGKRKQEQPVKYVRPAYRNSRRENPETTFLPLTLWWYGDLDGDGRTDYIIKMAAYDQYATVLFLSSAAESGQVVKAVAAYFMYET